MADGLVYPLRGNLTYSANLRLALYEPLNPFGLCKNLTAGRFAFVSMRRGSKKDQMRILVYSFLLLLVTGNLLWGYFRGLEWRRSWAALHSASVNQSQTDGAVERYLAQYLTVRADDRKVLCFLHKPVPAIAAGAKS